MKAASIVFLFLLASNSMAQNNSGNTKAVALRLKPHQDVKQSLLAFAKKNKMKAACIVSAVGSLEKFNLRYANQESGTSKSGHFEIVSLSGTISDSSSHLHMSVSDSTGLTIGGHLLEGNLVYTTLEVVMMELNDVEFVRVKDSTYGYQELEVKPRPKNKK